MTFDGNRFADGLTRRSMLTIGAGGIILVPAMAMASPQACVVPFGRDRYETYIRLYNAFDPAFLGFYADDVSMSLGPLRVQGRQAVYESFKLARANVAEDSVVTFFTSDATGMAAELIGTFTAVRDYEDFGRSVSKGQVRQGRALLIYTLDQGGLIKTIGGAAPEVVQDWH